MHSLEAVELFQICADDTGNSEAWTEFLRRYTVKIKYFINGTLRQLSGSSAGGSSMLACGVQDNDLFQNAIIRLVANDCAAMKRFSGKDEGELMAYLAVICRSSVLDTLRRTTAVKRTLDRDSQRAIDPPSIRTGNRSGLEEIDRQVLVRELVSLSRDTIGANSGTATSRDQLIFDLHFFHGLSFSQIAQCQGINLSKAGVEKLLKRLISRVQTLAVAGKESGIVL